MKLINTKKYKGFKTNFFILPKTEKFLLERKIKIEDYLMNEFNWYEHYLFELLNPQLNEKWSEEKETRKNFKVVLCGIIERWVEKNPVGFVENFKFDKTKFLKEDYIFIYEKTESPFAVVEKILVD